jgi:hypothetical protein
VDGRIIINNVVLKTLSTFKDKIQNMEDNEESGLDGIERLNSKLLPKNLDNVMDAISGSTKMYDAISYVNKRFADPLKGTTLGGILEAQKKISSWSRPYLGQEYKSKISPIEGIMKTLEQSSISKAFLEREYLANLQSRSAFMTLIPPMDASSYSSMKLLYNTNLLTSFDNIFGNHRNLVKHFDLLQNEYLLEEEDEKELEDEPELTSNQIILLNNVPRIRGIIHSVYQDNEELFNVKPRDFEMVIAEILKARGLKVELTKQTRDGGRDIIAIHDIGITQLRYLVECKRWKLENPVSVDVIRSFHSVLMTDRANKGFVCTTSVFSPDAEKYAATHFPTLMDLKDGKQLLRWIDGYMKNQKLHI